MIKYNTCLFEKSDPKKSLVCPKHKCENNIKMDLEGRGFDVVIWIHLSEWILISQELLFSIQLATRDLLCQKFNRL